MADAAKATAIMNMSAGACPRHRTPSAKAPAESSTIASASHRLKPAIWRSNGVVVSRTCSSIVPMRPSSVRAPVATTTPVATPDASKVPE